MKDLDLSRRYAAEFVGTFAIVFFGCGAVATVGSGAGAAGLLVIAGAFSLTVVAMIYAFGHISAAHFNPAVTVGLAAAGRFPWRYAGQYIVAQCAGALAASMIHRLLIGAQAAAVGYGATLPTVDVGRAIGIEAFLTLFLVLVIISVATDKRVNGAVPGIAIGITVAICILFGGPLTGASMNPARSLGPAVFAGGAALSQLWLYIVGTLLGAVAAAGIYEWIRGGQEHAQGAPNDLYAALRDLKEGETVPSREVGVDA